jgi:hypothetical protein
MSNVTNIRHAIPVSAEISKAVVDFSTALSKAIDDARDVGLPQSLLFALLHGQALSETQRMIE